MTNAQHSMENASKSLFERLGGTEGITKIVDDVVATHIDNPKITARFTPYLEEPERLAKIKQHTVDFFSAGSGGKVSYHGRDMETTHKGMNISAEEFMCVVDDIMLVLGKHNIDAKSQNEVLVILWSLKGMIMAK